MNAVRIFFAISQNDTWPILKRKWVKSDEHSLVFYQRLSLIRSTGWSDVETLDSILHAIKIAWANVAFWLMCSAMVNTLKASEIYKTNQQCRACRSEFSTETYDIHNPTQGAGDRNRAVFFFPKMPVIISLLHTRWCWWWWWGEAISKPKYVCLQGLIYSCTKACLFLL